jgi:hypothetical protein
MKVTGKRQGVLVGGVALLLGVAQVQAGYVINVVDAETGLSGQRVEVPAGTIRTLDLVLTSDGNDRHDSFGFNLGFSQPGLLYNSYSLASPEYLGGGPNDFSTDATGQPIVAPLHFEALTEVGGVTFGTGRLVSLQVGVPDNFLPVGVPKLDVSVFAIPDFFGNGFDLVDAVAGPALTLSIVPEPATLVLLGLGGLAAVRRRRS